MTNGGVIVNLTLHGRVQGQHRDQRLRRVEARRRRHHQGAGPRVRSARHPRARRRPDDHRHARRARPDGAAGRGRSRRRGAGRRQPARADGRARRRGTRRAVLLHRHGGVHDRLDGGRRRRLAWPDAGPSAVGEQTLAQPVDRRLRTRRARPATPRSSRGARPPGRRTAPSPRPAPSRAAAGERPTGGSPDSGAEIIAARRRCVGSSDSAYSAMIDSEVTPMRGLDERHDETGPVLARHAVHEHRAVGDVLGDGVHGAHESAVRRARPCPRRAPTMSVACSKRGGFSTSMTRSTVGMWWVMSAWPNA